MGYTGDSKCDCNPIGNDMQQLDCGFNDMFSTVQPRCDSKGTCTMRVDSDLTGLCSDGGPCKTCCKYLEVSYMCTGEYLYVCKKIFMHVCEKISVHVSYIGTGKCSYMCSRKRLYMYRTRVQANNRTYMCRLAFVRRRTAYWRAFVTRFHTAMLMGA